MAITVIAVVSHQILEYLLQEIKRFFEQHKGRYGSPRISLQLYAEGIETNKRVVAKLMQNEGLVSIYFRKRRIIRQEKSLSDYVRDNIIKRQFKTDQLNMVLVSDITYVPCKDGTLYLASYIDLAARMPRDYQMNTHMKKELIIEPLESFTEKTPLKGATIHSDRGSQYRAMNTRHSWKSMALFTL